MTDQASTPKAEEQEPVWARNWFVLPAGCAFGGAIIFADQFGEAGRTEWAIIFAVSWAISTAIFWSKRKRWWFWTSLIVLGALHAALLTQWSWHVVPAPSAYSLKGAVFLDLLLYCAWLWWMSWLFDPHATPRSPASVQVEIILYGFVLIMFATTALVWWGIEIRQQEVERESRVVAEGSTSNSVYDLERCFFTGRHPDDAWEPQVGNPNGETYRDDVYHTSVTVIDAGNNRRVRVTTLRGEPMHSKLAATYARCMRAISH